MGTPFEYFYFPQWAGTCFPLSPHGVQTRHGLCQGFVVRGQFVKKLLRDEIDFDMSRETLDPLLRGKKCEERDCWQICKL